MFRLLSCTSEDTATLRLLLVVSKHFYDGMVERRGSHIKVCYIFTACISVQVHVRPRDFKPGRTAQRFPFVRQVDKDVAVAKEHFGLRGSYNAMSPIIVHKDYTRQYLDGKV